MSDAEYHHTDDGPITRVLLDAEGVLDIDPSSLQQRKRALRDWMEGRDGTDRCEAEEAAAGPTDPLGGRPQFITWNPGLTLRPLTPQRRVEGNAAARLPRAIGDHACAVTPADSYRRFGVHGNESAETALHAVKELRASLMLLRVASHTRCLHHVLAEAERELTRTGHLSICLCRQLRIALTDARLDPVLRASAQAMVQLLEEDQY